ncbi:hypothetical protein PIB30_048133 [Stylosanthes scabra]|uniref:Uncharacterized protein n=1 Tax=Stylosanthes scabra TaxID=79078 RepID=A0ABU6TIW9_9FABA|nr:hypothetical protein [Stylosanthes scabra]
MSRRFSQIVVKVYPNRVPREGPDGVEFHSPDPPWEDPGKSVRLDLGHANHHAWSGSGSSDDELVGTTPVGTRFLLLAPVLISDLSTVDRHFHTLDLDAMEEDRFSDIGSGGDDYNLDGGRVTGQT